MSSSTKLAKIAGEIWFDRNKDGIDNASGDNLAYATVKLLDADFNVIATTQTDASGHYSFEGLQYGTYHVDFGPHHDYTEKDATTWCKSYKVDSDVTLGLTDAIVVKYGVDTTHVDAGIFTAGALDFDREQPDDGVVNGSDDGEVMNVGYVDAQGDEITDGDDVIIGNGGDDVISAGAGDDLIYGDTAGEQPVSNEVQIQPESGQYNLLVWQLSDLNIAGVKDYPFQDGDVTGEPTHEIEGGSLSIAGGSTPVTVGVNDNDGKFNDGDYNQTLANHETIDGVSDSAGNRFTPEYAYTIRDVDSGEITTIYAVELGANKMVGIVSDKPLTVGGNYEFVARVDKYPSVDYDDLADTYFTDADVVQTGGAGDQGGNDIIDGGAGDDTIIGGVGNDIIDGGTGNDVIYGDNAAGGHDGIAGYGPQLSVTIQSQAGAYNGALLAEVTDASGNVNVVTLTNNYDANVGRTFDLNLDAGDSVRLGITVDAGYTIWSDNAGAIRTGNVTENSARINFEDDGGHDFDDVVLQASMTGPATVDLPNGIEIGTDGSIGDVSGGDDVIYGGSGNDTIYGDNGVNGQSPVNGDEHQLVVTIKSQAGAYNGALLAEVTDESGNVNVVTLTNNYDANVGRTFELDLDAGDSVRLGITVNPGYTVWSDSGSVRGSHVTDNSAQLNFEDDGGTDFQDVVLQAEVIGTATLDLPSGSVIGNQETVVNGGGNDTITGGAGADNMYGEGGDDTFVVRNASDADGDVVVGGNGPDETQDNDTLDLRGAGAVTIDAQADADDAGAYQGTVTFSDGSTLAFSQIETVLKDDVPVNQAPDAVDDAIDPDVVGAVVIDPAVLLANDSDPDGDALSGVSVQSAQNGTVEFDGTNIIFTPDVGYQGPATFTYTIADGNGAEDTATVTLNNVDGRVAPDAPDTAPDLLATSDTGVSDTDDLTADNTPTFAIDNPEGLTPALYIDGVKVPSQYDPFNKTLTPAQDAPDGVYEVSYTLTGPSGVESDQSPKLPVEIDTTAPATPDGAPDMTAETDTGESSTDDVTQDTTPSFEIESPGENTPTLYVNGSPVATTFDPVNNTLTPTSPLPDGNHEVRYTLTDPAGNESQPSPALPFVIDSNPNQAPDAVDDVVDETPIGAITIDPATLLANDSDPDGDAISGVSVQDAVNGTVAFDGGNIVFTPTEGYVGDASFTYTITDGNGAEDTATVSLQVNGTVKPDQPEGAPDMTAPTDTGISDTDDLTSDTTPSFAVTVPDGLLPQLYVDGVKVLANYDAVEGTLTPFEPLGEGDHDITYSLIDNGVESEPSPALPIEIDTIAPDASDVAPDMTPETDTGLSDSDDYTADTTPSFEIGEVGENTPTLYIDGVEVPSVYEPVNETLTPVNPIAVGQHEVTFTLTDPAGNESAPSPALPIEINTTPENQSPDAVDDAYDQQTVGTLVCTVDALLANDTDADGDTLTVVSVQDAEFGTVSLADGKVTFVPMDGYQGPASFTYTVDDGKGGTDTAQVDLLVDGREVILAPDSAPDMTAETDTGVSDHDDLTNDTTPEFAIQDPGDYTPVLYVNGQEVPATYDASKGVLIPDQPLPNGELAVTYTLRNDQGQESPMSEALDIVIDDQIIDEVSPPDMTPASDTGVSDEDDVTSNDKPSFEIDAPEGLTPELYVDGQPVDSTFNPQTNQLTPVDPLPDGDHAISYKLIDGAGNETPLSEPLTVVIDTTAPDVGNIALTAESDTGESDNDGITDDTTPTFSIDPVADAQPTLYINGSPVDATFDAGNYTLTPTAPLPVGDYTVSYSLTDLAGNVSETSDPVSVTITTFETPVENTNPDAQDDVITEFVEGVVTIDPATLLANDTDADGDPLQGVSVQGAEHGSVTFDGNNILFTPDAGYVGPASFTYTIADGQGGTDTATVTIEKVDGVPTPAAPGDTPDLIAASDTGASDTDDITSDTTPSFSIADVGDNTPSLYIDGVKVDATYADGLLTPTSPLPHGDYAVTYTVTNAGGKESAPSGALAITITQEDGGNNGDDNFVFNGSFEDTTGMDDESYGYSAADGQIPGWTDKDGYLIDVHNDGRAGLNATDGNNWLDLGGLHSNNHVMQTIQGVQEGEYYELSFDVGDAQMDADGTSADNIVTVIWGGEIIAEINPADGVMERYTYTVEGGAGDGGNRLEFKGGGEIDNVGVSIDKVRMVSVDGDSTPDTPIDDTPDTDTTTPQPGALHFNDYTPGVDNPPPAGWYTDNPGGVIEVFPHDAYGVGGTPTNVLELERYGDDAGNFYTYVGTEEGESVTLEFDYSARAGVTDGENSAVHLLIDGEVYQTINTQEVGFIHFAFEIPGTGEPMRIEFQSADTTGVGGLLDNIYVSEDPLYPDGLPTDTPELPEEPPIVEDPAPEEPPVAEEPPVVENSAPDAQDDALEGTRDNAIVIDPATLLGNDTDADGDPLEGVSVQDPVNGTVVVDGGNVIFTPDDGYIGEASFTYTVTDGNGGFDTATVNLTVAPAIAEEPPVVVDPSPEEPPVEDTPDSDGDGGAGYLLTFEDFTPNDDSELPPGWYTDNPGSLIEVQPSDHYGVPGEPSNVLAIERDDGEPSDFYTFVKADVGETIELTFDYSAMGGQEGETDSAINIMVNDTIIDTVNAQTPGFTTFDYEIPATGEAMMIKFEAVDQNGDGGLLDNIKLNVTPLDLMSEDETPITPVDQPPVLVDEVPVTENTAPEAKDDTIEGEKTGVVVIDPATLLANDTDADGDALSGLSVQDAVNGTVIYDGQNIVFTPFDGYEGPASFSYTVSDGKGAVDSASVNLTIATAAPLAAQVSLPTLVDQTMTLDMDSLAKGMNSGLSGGWATDNAGGHVEVNAASVYGIPGESGNVLELERNEGDASNLYTTIAAAAGEPVTLSFDYSGRGGYEGADSTVNVLVNGVVVETVTADSVGFSSHQFSFTGTGEPMRVELQAADSNSTGGLVDNIQLDYKVTQAVEAQQSVTLDMDSLARDMNAGLPDGWATDNAGGRVEVNSARVYGIPGESRNVLELERNEGDASNLYTTVTAQAGEAVSLSFDYSARGGYEGADSAVNVLVNGVVVETVSAESAGFSTYDFTLTGTGEPMRVELQAAGSNSTGGLVDNIRIDYTAPGAEQSTVAQTDAPVIATSGDDTFEGTDLNEVVYGLEGNDQLQGGAGNDVIAGGEGDDVIEGGQGFDALTGGVGADTFTWSLSDASSDGPSIDIITDFGDGDDAINLKDLLVGESNDAETLSNYLHFETDGDKTTVHISAEGKFAHDAGGELDANSVAENTTQIIQLDGVDLTGGGSASDLQVIQNLISNNQLITD